MRLAVVFLFTLLPCAAQRPLRILWQDPGNIGALDFAGSVGLPVQPPKPPFTFVKEDLSGTQPKLLVKDAAGVAWDVKFGYEVKNESFCWRVVRACGYFAEPSFFVAAGQFESYKPMTRTTESVHPDGHFTNARFQFRDPNLRFLPNRNWRWDGPPFHDTPQLSGLKILIMLFSNWDNKDARVGKGGPNTAIFERRQANRVEWLYAFTDWGSGMGRWGSGTDQTDWRSEDYAAQTPAFVKGVVKKRMIFGWSGDINPGFQSAIPAAHAAWLMRYLGRITDQQFHAALKASGASDAEADTFTKALRDRIEQMRRLSH
ncbi:MAG TPA: hypothetical protein VGF59_35595 [Bryobacteraceae bacterium]